MGGTVVSLSRTRNNAVFAGRKFRTGWHRIRPRVHHCVGRLGHCDIKRAAPERTNFFLPVSLRVGLLYLPAGDCSFLFFVVPYNLAQSTFCLRWFHLGNRCISWLYVRVDTRRKEGVGCLSSVAFLRGH